MKQTSLLGIAKKAASDKAHRFQNLIGMLTVGYLLACWRLINKRAACGVDRQDARTYEANLQENVEALVAALKGGRYRAQLVLRKYIPKLDGKTRPLGIPAIADKVLQMGVKKILEEIYEQDFLGCSYGYRPEIGALDAVRDLSAALRSGRYHFLVEADIRSFLDRCSYYPLADDGSSKRSGRATGALIFSPLRLPCETWMASSSPRLTRCNTVWRDTPRMRMASTMGT